MPTPRLVEARAACDAKARAQGGAVSRSQAIDLGMAAAQIGREISGRRWRRSVHEGVYFVTTGPVSYDARCWAAVLHAGPEAALGMETAAWSWKILDEPLPVVHLIVPADKRPAKAAGRGVPYPLSPAGPGAPGPPSTGCPGRGHRARPRRPALHQSRAGDRLGAAGLPAADHQSGAAGRGRGTSGQDAPPPARPGPGVRSTAGGPEPAGTQLRPTCGAGARAATLDQQPPGGAGRTATVPRRPLRPVRPGRRAR